MNVLLLFVEIFFVFGSVIACKKFFGKAGMIAWVGIATVLANLLTAKNVDIFGMSVSMGTVWFASTFLATDIISESYTKQDAKKAVLFGIFSNVLFIIAPQITLAYSPSAVDYASPFMEGLFGLNIRISIASTIMYIIANLSDVFLYNKMKEKMQGKMMWVRNNICTILTNCLENFGFIALAFWGIYDIQTIVAISISTSVIEILVALFDTPFLYLAMKIKE